MLRMGTLNIKISCKILPFYGTEYSGANVSQKMYFFTQKYLFMGVIRVDYILY